MTTTHPQHESSVYEQVGGAEVLRSMVNEFYQLVEADPVLRPMFPDDLEPGKRYQFLFLCQLFSGEPVYSVERGHPRLRMRHFPFPIDREARDHWLNHMLTAIDKVGIQEPARSAMRDYFQRASEHMINRTSDGLP